MEKGELIRWTEIFMTLREHEDGELVKMLVGHGLPLESAERLVAFLPIAFGRRVIRQLGAVKFSDSFSIRDKVGLFQLSEEPIYRMAVEVAESISDYPGVSREAFSAVALRSAELSAANKALNAEESIDGAEFGPVVFWGYDTFHSRPWCRRNF
ncbi:hypothetical protein [Massilia sp. erpn]|uniref:hypothetical protein n=1 Tax=Massilia sp. erpn TaxID=2738142 RepID=UPI0021029F3B|nr:hypothetical protein [Massilia sp. erpn]UTY59839.1 hypothetical protein HPQ68_23230 [Massilia sp. erpn]